jgi:hypothetical protein
MNQSPRIKPTLMNGEDTNPKAVENRRAKEAVIGLWPRSVDLGPRSADPPWCPIGPSFGGSPSRVL